MTKQITTYSHTTAYATHAQGSWRWQDRYQLGTYKRTRRQDGTWCWRFDHVLNSRVKPNQVDHSNWTPHNHTIPSPEQDPISPYNHDN